MVGGLENMLQSLQVLSSQTTAGKGNPNALIQLLLQTAPTGPTEAQLVSTTPQGLVTLRIGRQLAQLQSPLPLQTGDQLRLSLSQTNDEEPRVVISQVTRDGKPILTQLLQNVSNQTNTTTTLSDSETGSQISLDATRQQNRLSSAAASPTVSKDNVVVQAYTQFLGKETPALVIPRSPQDAELLRSLLTNPKMTLTKQDTSFPVMVTITSFTLPKQPQQMSIPLSLPTLGASLESPDGSKKIPGGLAEHVSQSYMKSGQQLTHLSHVLDPLRIFAESAFQALKLQPAVESEIAQPLKQFPSQTQVLPEKEHDVSLTSKASVTTASGGGERPQFVAPLPQATGLKIPQTIEGTVLRSVPELHELLISLPSGTIKMTTPLSLPEGSTLQLKLSSPLTNPTSLPQQLSSTSLVPNIPSAVLLKEGVEPLLNHWSGLSPTSEESDNPSASFAVLKRNPELIPQLGKHDFTLDLVRHSLAAATNQMDPKIEHHALLLRDKEQEDGVRGFAKELVDLHRQAKQLPSQEWQSYTIPIKSGDEAQMLKLFIHQHPEFRDDNPSMTQGDGEGQQEERPSRFVVELELEHYGDVQCDGLVVSPKHHQFFDLVIRTERPFDTALEHGIAHLFHNLMGASSWDGRLRFEPYDNAAVNPTADVLEKTESTIVQVV